MTRDEAVTFIGTRFAAYLANANRTAADTTGNLKEIIDDAFRVLGFAAADWPTAETSGEEADEDLRVQLPYRTLEQVCRDIGATFFDVTVGDSFKLSQVRAACDKDLERAAKAVVERFGTVGIVDSDDGGITVIDLNYLADEALV